MLAADAAGTWKDHVVLRYSTILSQCAELIMIIKLKPKHIQIFKCVPAEQKGGVFCIYS